MKAPRQKKGSIPRGLTAEDHRSKANILHAKARLHHAKADMFEAKNPPKQRKARSDRPFGGLA